MEVTGVLEPQLAAWNWRQPRQVLFRLSLSLNYFLLQLVQETAWSPNVTGRAKCSILGHHISYWASSSSCLMGSSLLVACWLPLLWHLPLHHRWLVPKWRFAGSGGASHLHPPRLPAQEISQPTWQAVGDRCDCPWCAPYDRGPILDSAQK
jgi:hypothetical protein